MSNWISVKDGLPELDVPVLGWNSDGLHIVYCSIREDDNGYAWSGNCCCYDYYEDTITHWMPMIEGPPEEKE